MSAVVGIVDREEPASLLARLELVFSDPTLTADGTELVFNLAFFADLGGETSVGLETNYASGLDGDRHSLRSSTSWPSTPSECSNFTNDP